MMTLQIEPNGLFKVRVTPTDERNNECGSTFESNAVFLRQDGADDKKPAEKTTKEQINAKEMEFEQNRQVNKREFAAEPPQQTSLAGTKLKDWAEFAKE